jgi:hypothetical protein
MDSPFLTIAEAVEKTGRSPSTIRRLIRTIADTPAHQDRGGVEPTPQAVETLKKKAENFTWKIREDLIAKHLKGAQKEGKRSMEEGMEATSGVLHILERELSLKNQQIEKQWEVIHALNERLREGNILMGSLQKRLSLPSSEPIVEAPVETETVAVAAKAHQKASAKPSAQNIEKASKKAKRGLLRWILR